MEGLCTGCLCEGRKLQDLSNSEDFYTYGQILNEIPVYDMSRVMIHICWECRALLRKFRLFKEQVKRSYVQLMQCIATPSFPRLTTHHHLFEPPFVIKSDPDLNSELDIKSEPEDIHNDTAFADELSACDEKEEYQQPEPEIELEPETKPTIKIKKKSKSKIKKKKSTKNIKAEKRKKRRKEKAIETCENLNDNVQDEAREEMSDVRNEEKSESGLILETEVNVPAKVIFPTVAKLDEKPKCTECGKTFSSRKTYKYHMNVLHGGNNRHECPRCDKVYQWKSNLGRHLRTHKAVDAGELYCELCDKSFASVATYRQHMRISRRHVSESDFAFVCNECGKKFVNKTRLRDHIDWEHLKKIKYKCLLCNKPFKCHTSLYLHMQNVHRNKEKKDNLCHVCGKSYQNAAKLKYHITAMHSGSSPYRCGECGAAFGWYSSLYRHLRELHYKVKVSPKKCRRSRKLPDLLELPPAAPALR